MKVNKIIFFSKCKSLKKIVFSNNKIKIRESEIHGTNSQNILGIRECFSLRELLVCLGTGFFPIVSIKEDLVEEKIYFLIKHIHINKIKTAILVHSSKWNFLYKKYWKVKEPSNYHSTSG